MSQNNRKRKSVTYPTHSHFVLYAHPRASNVQHLILQQGHFMRNTERKIGMAPNQSPSQLQQKISVMSIMSNTSEVTINPNLTKSILTKLVLLFF